jgi:hypothetical protein
VGAVVGTAVGTVVGDVVGDVVRTVVAIIRDINTFHSDHRSFELLRWIAPPRSKPVANRGVLMLDSRNLESGTHHAALLFLLFGSDGWG